MTQGETRKGPTPKPGILDIALYVGGAASAPGAENPIKLSSNENPFGAPESARAAIRESLSEGVHRYPSTDHASLRRAIGEVHGLEADRIICGVGSDEIFGMVCMAYLEPGDEAIHTRHGFAMYRICTLWAGGVPVEVPERERVVDVDAILSAVTERTRLVFIANPANPSGTMMDEAEVLRLADGLPEHVLLILDGAYAEFVEGFDGGAGLAATRPNVLMTRTFSKLYGLGGLRIGWAYGPRDMIDVLTRVRQPFNLSNTQLMAAEAAVRDRDWAEWCRTENDRLRSRLTADLRGLGIALDTSFANFVLARFRDAAEADAAHAHLMRAGLITRKVAGYHIPEGLRITVGDEAACTRLARALADFRAMA
ncbi:histidinol-phosphate transaminase [Roseicyclus sp. F158]|uniref:Histidinol-phosphate aminotransferase n=1 Tax=Tropicimonas omnivorans TaxID=3075590 RepID=A0ABU3DG74_9RHOB|nr:histidinol-phosphate transaminase [Roseicyclus sp. F158]MDT0682559.1 histidinol-phosphate transaminase [Roseicyclus sp. F158]